jgi:hypothetical protein
LPLLIITSTAHAQDIGPMTIQARTWSPATPISNDAAPALQSEPSIAINGNTAFVAWTDSRNAIPDIYAAAFVDGAKQPDRRVTNIGPQFDAQRAHGASITVEPSGRAFAVYSDGQDIYLARYDVASGQWLSRTQVTSGLDQWWAVARYPQIASDGSGNLVIAWEDFRNANTDNNSANSKGSDIYAETCNGNTMTCAMPNVKVNDDAGRADQRRPRLSRSGNNVVVVWEDTRERGNEFPRIYASFSTNGGASWGGNGRINKNFGGVADVNTRDTAANPAVTYAPDGTAYATWENRVGSATAQPDIYVAQWNGSAWGTPWRADRGPGNARALNPTIASGSAGTFAAWQDYRNGTSNPDIYTARWDGGSWNEVAAATQPGMQTLPALAASGGNVRLAWQDARSGSADVRLSTWNGGGWANEAQVNDGAARASYQMAPSVASDGNATYAALLDQRDGYKQLWLSQLTSSGGVNTWSPLTPFPTEAREGGDIASEGVEIAFGGSTLHAVWSEYVWPYGMQVQYSAYTNGKWADPTRLTGGTGDDRPRFSPTIAANGNAVAAVWSYRETNNQAQLYASWNTGSGWSNPTPVLQQPYDAWIIHGSAALTGNGTLAVAWTQAGANGRNKLMVARRNIGGGGWGYAQVSPDVNSDWCGQESPQIRADSAGKLHLAWSGCALRNPPNAWPHDSYVFYSSSSDGGATWSAPLRVAQTIAPNDEANHNDTSSRPALAIGPTNEVMVIYPTRAGGAWTFNAALIANGAVASNAQLGDGANAWAKPGQYFGDWYGGDSVGAIAFDPIYQRYVVAFPDRRNGRSPRIYAATYGDSSIVLNRRVMLSLIRK